jgi:hypothetical protein
MACGCGNSTGSAGAPLLSGVLAGQYAEDVGGLALSNPPSSSPVAADVAATPGAAFTGVGGFLAVLLFIGIAVVVVRGASKKSE